MQETSLKETPQIPAFRRRVAAQMADYRQRLADQLEHERESKSLSRESLAARAGVSERTIKRIEGGLVDNPRPVTIRRLAEALEITPATLRPPNELEREQLDRIEEKLDALLEWAETAEIESAEGQSPVQDEAEASGAGQPSPAD